MHWIGLIPVFPLLAAGVLALTDRQRRRFAASVAIGALGLSTVLSLLALAISVIHWGERFVVSVPWFQFGSYSMPLDLLLDPLSAAMVAMVCVVSLAIFIYSVGYMEKDWNFVRFFCFLSLFVGAMTGLVLAGNLLILFVFWELVGLTSYLLIGFWYERPSAAAAAKKAFITTRIGDLGFLLGLVWLAAAGGTLTFYAQGQGCLEPKVLQKLAQPGSLGIAVAVPISLLLFLGAIGKSGQFPLHVWLPDAMEGPTPVSALIHAATMVAAGVYLMARMFPLAAIPAHPHGTVAPTLVAMAAVGAFTVIFAAVIAIGQNDIKRILAYSTISQLGYMFLGLGVGSVAAAIFHLLTHAFFKALLFLGAGSVIHGCHEEQDIRKMGGLARVMPTTFQTYLIAAMALCGVPLLFSGFWSKDAILHAAHQWPFSSIPYWFGAFGAVLTAFYMTRQVSYVFFGTYRNPEHPPHESPRVILGPLVFLALFAVVLGFFGTPWWPGIQSFLLGEKGIHPEIEEIWKVIIGSTVAVAIGIGVGWWLYGMQPPRSKEEPDRLERWIPAVFRALSRRLYVDELYQVTVIRWQEQWSVFWTGVEEWVWGLLVQLAGILALGWAWLTKLTDDFVVNRGFDAGCSGLRGSGGHLSRLQHGRLSGYVRSIGVMFALLFFLWFWVGR